MTPRLATVFGIAFLLAATVVPLPGTAHLGNGGDFTGMRLEGEDYDLPDANCDPAADGDHTRAEASPGASGGAVGVIPFAGCGLTFNVNVPVKGYFAAFRVTGWGFASDAVVQLHILADGYRVGRQVIQLGPSFATASGPLQVLGHMEPGLHTIRVYTLVQAPPNQPGNVGLDYMDFEAGTVFLRKQTKAPAVGTVEGGASCTSPAPLAGVTSACFTLLPNEDVFVIITGATGRGGHYEFRYRFYDAAGNPIGGPKIACWAANFVTPPPGAAIVEAYPAHDSLVPSGGCDPLSPPESLVPPVRPTYTMTSWRHVPA